MYEARSLVVDFSGIDRLGVNPGLCNMTPARGLLDYIVNIPNYPIV